MALQRAKALGTEVRTEGQFVGTATGEAPTAPPAGVASKIVPRKDVVHEPTEVGAASKIVTKNGQEPTPRPTRKATKRKKAKAEVDEADEGEAQEDEPPKKTTKIVDHATPEGATDSDHPTAAHQPEVKWAVTRRTYAAASKAATALGHSNDERITFLCAKGVKDDLTYAPDRSAGTKFGLLVNPPDGAKHKDPKIKDECQKWVDRQNSLHCILGLPMGRGRGESRKVGDYAAIPEDISFTRFVQQHPEWRKQNDVFVFFRDHPSVVHKDVLIQRMQLFGTCAIHAPVVMQHYLVAMHNRGPAPTLDISGWMRKRASAYLLDGVLFGRGAPSDVVLEQTLIDDSDSWSSRFADIPKNLEHYGPGLLPWWGVADDFLDVTQWQHCGRPATAKPLSEHSMLVVGYRRLDDGSVRLLLQNWWHSKQFVEVDEAYYRHCVMSCARFVTAPQDRIPFPGVTNAVFAVSAADGSGVNGIGLPAGMP